MFPFRYRPVVRRFGVLESSRAAMLMLFACLALMTSTAPLPRPVCSALASDEMPDKKKTAEKDVAASALEIYGEVMDITAAKKELAQILKDAEGKVPRENRDSLLHAKQILAEVHGVVKGRKLIEDDCVDRAIRYLAVAEKFDQPIRIFPAGNHVFVSFKGSYFDLGWEPLDGKWRNHSDYQEKYLIEKETIDNGVFLAPLDKAGLHSIVYTNVGAIHREKGDQKKALKALDKAVELNPKNCLAVASRGLLRIEMGQREDGLADLEKAVKMYPAHDTALWHLAMERHRLGKYKSAADALQQILRYYPRTDPVVKEWRDIFKEKAVLEPAVAHFGKLKDANEHVIYLFPKSGRLFDVTIDGDATSARPDWKKIAELPLEDEVFVLHNHRLTKENYFKLLPLTKEERARADKLDPATFERRMFTEVPSPTSRFGRGGDFDLAMMTDARIFARNPATKVRHFIVCFRQSAAPQVVEYGLSDEARKVYFTRLTTSAKATEVLKTARTKEKEDAPALKAAQEACSSAYKEEEAYVVEALRAYDKAWNAYAKTILKPYSEGPGKEPDFEEFSKQVKEQSAGTLFLKSYGNFGK